MYKKDVDKVLSRESGIYSSKSEDGEDVYIFREVGHGFTVKILNSKGIFECDDYDEQGLSESSYVEYAK